MPSRLSSPTARRHVCRSLDAPTTWPSLPSRCSQPASSARAPEWLVVLHLFQVGLWAVAFWGVHALPNFETALYFSLASYTTLGCG